MHLQAEKSNWLIIHRDLKCENILVENKDSKNIQIKMTDFGLSHFHDKDAEKPRELIDGIIGTPKYVAPEIISGEDYTEKADVWSAMVICYELLTSRPLFYFNSVWDLLNKI